MSEYLLFNKLNDYFNNNIKLSFVSNNFIVIITIDNTIYKFERNTLYSYAIVISDNEELQNLIENKCVPELCDKKIIEIYSNNEELVFLTSEGNIYSWYCSYQRPKLRKDLDQYSIINISCGNMHTLVLTSDGSVFGWGNNHFKQICNNEIEYFAKSQSISINGEIIKAISCGSFHSIALTDKGGVYGWGWNDNNQITSKVSLEFISEPIKIVCNSSNYFQIICCSEYSFLFSEGFLHMFGSDIIDRMGDKVIEIESLNEKQVNNRKLTVLLNESNNKYYQINQENCSRIFEKIEDYLLFYLNINLPRITLMNKLYKFKEKFYKNGYFSINFQVINTISDRINEKLLLVKHKDSGVESTIIRIDYNSNDEKQIINKLINEVNNYRYDKAWKELNNHCETFKFDRILYIQIETIDYETINTSYENIETDKIINNLKSKFKNAISNKINIYEDTKKIRLRDNLNSDFLNLPSIDDNKTTPDSNNLIHEETTSESKFLSKLSKYFMGRIKLSYINEFKVVIITKDDDVYVFQRSSIKSYAIVLYNDDFKLKILIEGMRVIELSNKRIVDIRTRFDEMNFLTKEGKVYSWLSGQRRPVLREELTEHNVKDICCGHMFTLVLTTSGEVYGWGHNTNNRIFDNYIPIIDNAIKIIGFDENKIKAISCGHSHSLALTESGYVYGWGLNTNKQVDNKSQSKFIIKPLIISDKSLEIINISAGPNQSYMLSNNGIIYILGEDIIKTIETDTLSIKDNIINIMIFIKSIDTVKNLLRYKLADIISMVIEYSVSHYPILSHFYDNLEEFFAAKFNINYRPVKNDFQFKIFIDLFFRKPVYIIYEYKTLISQCSFGKIYIAVNYLYNKAVLLIENEYKSKDEIEIINRLLKSELINYNHHIWIDRYERNCENNNNAKIHILFEIGWLAIAFILQNVTHYNTLNTYFMGNIKLSYISFRRIFILTNKDEMYIFKQNNISGNALLLCNDNIKLENYIEDMKCKRLCNKNIINIKIDYWKTPYFLTSDGKVYSLSHNNIPNFLDNNVKEYIIFDQLLNEKYFFDPTPKYRDELNDKHVIDISCGYNHVIILTSDGCVYGWGNNSMKQIIDKDIEHINTAIELNLFNGQKIKSISCGAYHSLALTEIGYAYGWGQNIYKHIYNGSLDSLIISFPRLVCNDISEKVNKICCGPVETFLLTDDGYINIYYYNKVEKVLKTILIDLNGIITDMEFYSSIKLSEIVFCIRNNVYTIDKDKEDFDIDKVVLTDFDTIETYILNLSNDSYRILKNGLVKFINTDFTVNKYNNKFEELKELGQGSFGKVIKVRKRKSRIIKDQNEDYNVSEYTINENLEPEKEMDYILFNLKTYDFKDQIDKEEGIEEFAVKLIEYNSTKENEFMNEIMTIETIEKIKCENLVFYYDIWVERKSIQNDNYYDTTLYIQMELCDMSLDEYMKRFRSDKIFYKYSILNESGFQEMCKIFEMILKGVEFLHSLLPQIIHRDINPYNIMIKIENENIIAKIGDFGLATIHRMLDQLHSSDVGKYEFCAPEVHFGNDYDTRADIYSLGKVSEYLFSFRNKSCERIAQIDNCLKRNLENMRTISKKMCRVDKENRFQTVKEIIQVKCFWNVQDYEFY